MSEFPFLEGENVLFVGEGNFTFCSELVKSQNISCVSKVYATCLEEEHNSIVTKETKEFLLQSGVNLIFDVDATKLSNHLILGKLKFNRIVFNFPHIGGKMKIHLNRKLLQDFFVESSLLLYVDGEIIVTLCAGQGGTPAEVVKRRWDDTWQVVEMAARGGLILRETKCFPYELLCTYASTGYRGGKKSFNTKNAIIHYFRLGPSLMLSVDDVLNRSIIWHKHDGVLMPYVYKKKIDENPFSKSNTPQSYFIKILEDICKKIDNDYLVTSEVPLFSKFPVCSSQVECFVLGEKCYLRKNLLHVTAEREDCKHYIISGLGFNRFHDDCSTQPAECHVAIFGPRRNEICALYVSLIQNLCHSYLQRKEEKITVLNANNWFQLHDDNKKGVDINLDKILVNVFEITMRQLWCTGITLKVNDELPLLIPPSLYPQLFSFDISFVATVEPLNVKKLLILVQEISCDLIESSRLLNVYKPLNKSKIIYCFRFEYKSYSIALCRRKALAYHNVVGKAIEQILNVKII